MGGKMMKISFTPTNVEMVEGMECFSPPLWCVLSQPESWEENMKCDNMTRWQYDNVIMWQSQQQNTKYVEY